MCPDFLNKIIPSLALKTAPKRLDSYRCNFLFLRKHLFAYKYFHTSPIIAVNDLFCLSLGKIHSKFISIVSVYLQFFLHFFDLVIDLILFFLFFLQPLLVFFLLQGLKGHWIICKWVFNVGEVHLIGDYCPTSILLSEHHLFLKWGDFFVFNCRQSTRYIGSISHCAFFHSLTNKLM